MEQEEQQQTTIQISLRLWKYLTNLKKPSDSFETVIWGIIESCNDNKQKEVLQ